MHHSNKVNDPSLEAMPVNHDVNPMSSVLKGLIDSQQFKSPSLYSLSNSAKFSKSVSCIFLAIQRMDWYTMKRFQPY